MGYYAEGCGSVVAKDKAAAEAIKKILEDDCAFDGYTNLLYDKPLEIILQCDDKYYEDEVYDFLHTIEGYIVEGMIEYVGEDNSHWAFRFDSGTGSWEELYGRILYGMSELSEDELIAELESRGYVITKKAPDPTCSLSQLLSI